jgi:hypothetical protein
MTVQAVIYTTRLAHDPLSEAGALTPEQARGFAARLRAEEERGNITVISRPSIALREADEAVVEVGSSGEEPESRIRLTCVWRGLSLDCSVDVRAGAAEASTRGRVPAAGDAVSILRCGEERPADGQGPVMISIRPAIAG